MEKQLKLIGRKIAVLRNNAKMTSEELAVKARLTQAYISRVEHGKVPGVSVDTIMRIAKALNVSISAIVDDELTIEAVSLINLIRNTLSTETKSKKKSA